jgi:hypothetical protein
MRAETVPLVRSRVEREAVAVANGLGSAPCVLVSRCNSDITLRTALRSSSSQQGRVHDPPAQHSTAWHIHIISMRRSVIIPCSKVRDVIYIMLATDSTSFHSRFPHCSVTSRQLGH